MERFVGNKAPRFAMQAVTGDGETFKEISLDDYSGRWLVMFFYPMDFTFVCPTEITGFSESFEKFEQAGACVLGVSCDSIYTHQAWINDGLGKIRFPLASDKTLEVARNYGVLLENEGVALRGLFIIDPDQVVRYAVIHDNNVGRSMDETYRVLKALQTGGLCGANWSDGEANLQTGSQEAPAFASHFSGKVRVYSTPGCSYCKRVKEFLTENNIAYDDINLETDKDGQAFMNMRKYTKLPVTVIGDEEVVGYQMERLKKLLG